MAVKFNVPKAPKKSIVTLDRFLGADFTNNPSNVDITQSPSCQNLIRYVPGKVRKCLGWANTRNYNATYVHPFTPGSYAAIGTSTTVGTDGKIEIYITSNSAEANIPIESESQVLMDYYRSIMGDEYSAELVFDALPEWPSSLSSKKVKYYNDLKQYYVKLNFSNASGTHIEDLDLRLKYDSSYGLDDRTIYGYHKSRNDDDGIIHVGKVFRKYSSPFDFLYVGANEHRSMSFEFDKALYIVDGKRFLRYEREENITDNAYNESKLTNYVVANEPVEIKLATVTTYNVNNRVEFSAKTTTSSNGVFRIVQVGPKVYEVWYSDLIPTAGTQKSYSCTVTIILSDEEEEVAATIPTHYLVGVAKYETPKITPVDVDAYVPLITISKDPDGGGTSYEDLNLLSSGFTERFLPKQITQGYSDTVFLREKATNNVVVGDEVTLIIAEYETPIWARFWDTSTTSANGHFDIDRTDTAVRITYTDRLTTVGTDVSYSCEWGVTYDDPDAPHEEIIWEDDSITTHHLVAIQDGTWLSTYYLSFDNLDKINPIVKVLNSSTGAWDTKTINVDYTFNPAAGSVTFTTAPTRPKQSGEDRVSITAYKTFPGYSDRINKCTIGTIYGVNGGNDRLFLSGNPDYPNYDWYSGAYMLSEDEQDQSNAQTNYTDPTYFPDTGYSVVGSSSSAIVGYSRIGNYLATHKDKYERDFNVLVRQGDLVESEPIFRVVNTLQGAPAIAPYSFNYLSTEPLFLTDKGIYAITALDITGEKYAQDRSYYLNGKLLTEANLKDAYAVVFNDMYWLFVNGVAYILDGIQPIRTDKSEPYSTRQYVGFYRTNVPATCAWVNDNKLFFGTEDGKVKQFYTNQYASNGYSDDGEPIEAIWDTPDITGNVFFKNKTLKNLFVKLDSYLRTSVNIYVMNRGLWDFVRTDYWGARWFKFSKIDFSKINLSSDENTRVIPKKYRLKNVDKFRIKLSNDRAEFFAIDDIGVEFIESDNYTR
jgi:hypothetical protein